MHHKTIGIIGMGRIGMALGRRAHCGFGMNVLYYNNVANPQAERELGARQVSLDELLANSDFVCVVLPLSPETEKFIGAERAEPERIAKVEEVLVPHHQVGERIQAQSYNFV